MKIKIIFPKIFFRSEQLKRLEKHDVEFIEGNDIDLEKVKSLFSSEEYILIVNPAYLKDNWDAFPIERVKRMQGLKALCLTTSSYSWIDVGRLAKMGIIVTNIPGAPTEAVAEFNIYMMFSLLRKLPLIVKNNWKMDYDNYLNKEAVGLTAGIIGLGRIGERVAELCKGLGLDVYYWNRTKKNTLFKAVSLEKLFDVADIIFSTLATPPELKGSIHQKLLSQLKETAIIVSTSDTHVFDEKYILDKVACGKLGGYAFESNEKKLTDYQGNVMVFPEQAYFTAGTQFNRAKIATETVLSIIKGKPKNKVN
ncbi:MAG: NAD(P)-dependent oxidoreductase [Candidatus Gottesmanbacteria bacterium]|nr:NAD(P)-dependent oxidoreductase [Candidatus Gottesmanbacteria bacterium]